MRVHATVIVLGALFTASMGCYPEQINSISRFVSVTTLVDSQAPLRNARNFALPDTIVHLTPTNGPGIISHSGDEQMIARVRAELVAFGWREVTDIGAERPDVVVLMAVLEQPNTGVAYAGWWSDWGWWPGWPVGYGSDWNWGYPADAVTFTYETGTLLITMLDLQHGDASARRVPLLWGAGVNGVITSSSLQGALNGIDQAFAQSPYLERK
jgi:uncharacterized protein DUF4136